MFGWLKSLGQNAAARWRWFWGLRPAGPATAAGERGRLGEEAAALFLRERGWKIIIRNWRHGRDELDVVAWDGEVLVFAEVRARAAHAPVQGYHSVTGRKKHALARAVRAYLRGLPAPPAHFRFDIVEVKVSDGAAPEVVLHAGVPLLPNHPPPARESHRRE
ncbi:MAG TPA: YraN family protein [Opitutales bacterium]|nr:YraN family protein [Opitutales bacterium]